MHVLFIVPEIRIDASPQHFPFWAGNLGSIAEQKGGQVGILDLNALRENYKGNVVPNEIIEDELRLADWDLVCIGGLTSTYSRIKQLVPLIRKNCPDSIILSGGGWSTYNPDEIFKLVPEINMICIGEGEETFSEIYDKIEKRHA